MNHPIHVLSLGAGVQSSTLALMAAAGEVTPMPVAAIFADTQAEPASVYRWLDWLEKQLPFPVHRVTKGSLTEAALSVRFSKPWAKCAGCGMKVEQSICENCGNAEAVTGGGNAYNGSHIPAFLKSEGVEREGLNKRQCTRNYKIDAILREIRRIGRTEIKGWRKGKKVAPAPIIQWIGISRDEVTRMKPSRLDYIDHRWPLIDMGMTRKGCLSWMNVRGFPMPPRSACVYCPYHNDEEWLRLKTDEPEEFERAAEFEGAYQLAMSQIQRRSAVPFLHRTMVPLREIDFETAVSERQERKARQPDMFTSECEGMCGV